MVYVRHFGRHATDKRRTSPADSDDDISLTRLIIFGRSDNDSLEVSKWLVWLVVLNGTDEYMLGGRLRTFLHYVSRTATATATNTIYCSSSCQL